MFVYSVHRRQIKMLILLLCIAVVASAFAVVRHKGVQTANPAERQSVRADSAEARIAYLSQFGWEVDAEPVEISEVIIPAEFDETYTQYNALQKEQGFDLTPYADKRVKRWIYHITNYPEHEGDASIQATLLIYDGQVIGGDVCSTAIDGFMHGFVKKS